MSIFSKIQVRKRKRSPFDLSHECKLTTEFGRLTPFLCEPVLPNDKFKVSSNILVRFAPLALPVMQRFNAYLHYFFVPNRLIWTEWETFVTGGEDGLQNPAYPYIKLGTHFDYMNPQTNPIDSNLVRPSSLFDYLGFPTLDQEPVFTSDVEFDALPFKAYQLVWNEYYRDQTLQEPFPIYENLSGGQPTGTTWLEGLLSLRQRAWRKDYFTSALPDPQRGPDVTLPVAGDIDIQFTPSYDPFDPHTLLVGTDREGDGAGTGSLYETQFEGGVDAGKSYIHAGSSATNEPLEIDNSRNLSGRLVDSQGDPTMRSATINEVRRAFAIQRWYELAARAGSRYIEQIFAHFGIRSSDARLQRPEYLGGSVVPILVGDVLQTSATDYESEGTPLGTPAGVANGVAASREFRRTFEEHGWILGILSIVPDSAYMQGIPRKFLKRDKFDFAWPLLANIGEQEIQNQELYFDWLNTDGKNEEGFGYAPRYSEYKFGLNSVHGSFRDTLLGFHDTRLFDSMPKLNEDFVTIQTPDLSDSQVDPQSGLNRIFSVTNSIDHLWCQVYNKVKVLRVLPKYGTPI